MVGARNPTPLLTREAARRLDQATIAAGTPSEQLMERAGQKISEQLIQSAPRLLLNARAKPSLLVLAGSGNNGGDGLVVARLLSERGWNASVALCCGAPRPGSDARANLVRWKGSGGTTTGIEEARVAIEESGYDLVLDALFGTGLDRPLEGPVLRLIESLNRSQLPVVAVDIPSGLDGDQGLPLGAAVCADATVTLGAGKPGLFLASGPNCSGKVSVADIGLLDPGSAKVEVMGEVLDLGGMRGGLEPRPRSLHKGQLGHVLIVGASAGKTGAAVLAARAALRTGAGLVTMAVPATLAPQVDAALTEAMTMSLADSAGSAGEGAWRAVEPSLGDFDAIVAGPGLGTGAGAREIVHGLIENSPRPLVLDADALNIVAQDGHGTARALERRGLRGDFQEAILTPHPGEMARLMGTGTDHVQENRIGACRGLAHRFNACVVLKGAATVVAQDRRLAFNSSGNPGMATAGMGDVLAGTIGSLAARVAAYEAAAIGVYLHGHAADLLEAGRGGPGFLASEVADALPAATSALTLRH